MLLSRMTAAFGATHPGLHRDRNEDAFLVAPQRGLFAVADGLGGLPHGEVASQFAIEALEASSDSDLRDLDQLFNSINRSVRREGMKLSGETGIGTTLICAVAGEDVVTIAHVGDCAAFLVDAKQSRQVTHDQTLAQQMRENGEASIPEYLSHILTQCVGQGGMIRPEILSLPFREGARLILCSDGITKVIEDGEILMALASADAPKAVVEWLIETANNRGGPDNSTVVAVFR
jgi:protein phosphatase